MDLILASYRLNDTLSAIRFFDRRQASLGWGRRVLVLNDPSLLPRLQPLSGEWEVIDGSNALGEFSAWQEGLDRLPATGSPVMFANDTIDTHRIFTLFRWWAIRQAVRNAHGPSLVGFTDAIPGDLWIDGMKLDRWVSTYCFVVSAEALGRLNRRVVEVNRISTCVIGGVLEDKFFANMSPTLNAHLRRWLFSGWWYGGGALTGENRERLTKKAEAVVAEKLLSARSQKMGVHLVDPFHRRALIKKLDGVCRRVVGVLQSVRLRLGVARQN